MKCFPLIVLLFSMIACNNEEPQASKAIVTNTGAGKDSGIIKKDVSNPYAAIDISPADISYFPVDYPVKKMSDATTAMPAARVIYSRPHRQGRKVFGSLLKYGEPWRLGANEATELEFFQPVTIQNKQIPKGRYILYAVPQQNQWTIVFNSNLHSWGLKQDPKKDLYRFDIPVQPTTTNIEYFTMVFEATATGANLLMAWDDSVARLPIVF